MPNAYRVANRFLWGTPIADPTEDLHKFQRLVEVFCSDEEFANKEVEKVRGLVVDLKQDPESWRALLDEDRESYTRRLTLEVSLPSRYRQTRNVAQPLFWSILQQYQLPPKIQRGIEAASRFWSKPKLTKPRVKNKSGLGRFDSALTVLEAYTQTCFELRKQVTDAQLAIAKGKLFSDPDIAAQAKTKVGSFTLINTGGFKDTVVKEAAVIVKKVEASMRGIGLGKVCYGDILISKTINNKRTVAAFYVTASDEMFIRANIPANWDIVRTICHELSHRLLDRFLQGKHGEVKDVYRTIYTQQFTKSGLIPEEYLPERGEEVVAEGKTYKLIEVSRYDQKVKFTKEGDKPNTYYTSSLLFWLKMKGIEPHQIPDFKGFITKYAATDPEENFCEMLSFYAIGKLPQSQVELLAPILS